MFDFNAPTPTGFHADFALCVMIPLAEAAYAGMNQPGVAPKLPPGFQMTGLIQADETLRQAILNLPNQSKVAKAVMDDSGIFGLMGKNPGTKTEPCSWCGIYYGRSDPGALFDCGELVCFDCVTTWWSHRSPELSANDREKAERELRRWLVGHNQAEVIRRQGDLPKTERRVVKLVTGCEQCDASGKTYTGGRCSHCDGRGTVWVVVRAPDFGPSPDCVRAEVSRHPVCPRDTIDLAQPIRG